MGYANHYDHFLERLSRIDDDQVDFAMSLYYDPHFVRGFLEQYDIPDHYERVAVAIDDDPDGPHIVLARDGGFVTCLGRGMSPNGLYRIPRVELDAKHGLHEAMVASMRRIEEEGTHAHKLGEAIKRKALSFDRVDLGRLQSLGPLILDRALDAAGAYPRSLARRRRILTVRLGRKVTRLGRDEADVERYWRDFFYLHHMSVLAAINCDELAPLVSKESFSTIFGDVPWWTMREGMSGPCLRALWCAGRMGEHLDDYLFEQARKKTTPGRIRSAVASLMTIGLRHPHAYQPVLRLLRGWTDGIKQIPESKRTNLQGYRLALGKLVLPIYTKPEAFTLYFVELTRRVYADILEKLSVHPDDALGDPDSLTEADALAFQSLLPTDIRTEPAIHNLVFTAIPLLARADIADLYAPRKFANVFPGWTPYYGVDLFHAHANAKPPKEPVVVEDTPGRNDPCHCGSRRKYKRCCMRKDAEAPV